MATISGFVLGRYWRSTNEAQRSEFQRLFVDLIVDSYSVRFSEYLGEGIKVTVSSAEGGGTIQNRASAARPYKYPVRCVAGPLDSAAPTE